MTRTFTDDNEPIHVQIVLPAAPDDDTGLRDTWRGAADKVKQTVQGISDEALFQAFKNVYKVARKSQALLADLNAEETSHQLNQAQIQFGLNFSASGEAFLTVGVEATISISLTWERKA